MAADTAYMARPKKNSDEQYRRPYKQARVRISLAVIAEARAAALAQDFTQYVNDAIRMRLEAEAVWPPPPPAKPGR